MDQERENLPSASGVQRLMQCQASHRMTLKARGLRQEAGESGGKGDQWREKGNAMHEAIFSQSDKGLETDQDRMDYAKLMRRFREFLGGWGAMNEDTVIREERLWLHQEIEPIFSGRPDYIRISMNRRRAAIIDFKSLWAKAPEPVENDQLWSQAVLLAEDQPEVQDFTFQLISPHYTYRPHLATRQEVLDYEIKLRMMLGLTQVDTEPKTGDQCKHCGGLLICPKIKEEAKMKRTHPSELDIKNAGKLLEQLERMEKYIKECREYFKLVLAKDANAIPGYRIMEKSMRFLKNPEKIYDAVVPPLGDKEFWGAVSISITKIEAAWEKLQSTELLHSENPIPNSAVVLAPFITTKKQEASLVKNKETKK